jgi:hypothetical protein
MGLIGRTHGGVRFLFLFSCRGPLYIQLDFEAMHIKTDVFCSASIILPDKAGRQVNIGGWSLDSTFGLRLFTPDGSPGQPSHNNWEEDVNVLKLQVSSKVTFEGFTLPTGDFL